MHSRFYWTKLLVRVLGAALCRTKVRQRVGDTNFFVWSGVFWPAAPPDILTKEVGQLLGNIGSIDPKNIIDAGSALGMFTLPAAKTFPDAHIFAFEPSLPERTLFRRNLQLNAIQKRVTLIPYGLWNQDTKLLFRSHGYLSGIAGIADVTNTHPANERIKVRSLDSWWEEQGRPKIDLIKMDIEGSEIEALQGAKVMLANCRPRLLVEAYHVRDGKRTFEPVVEILNAFGYECAENPPDSGLLVATSRIEN